MAEKLRDLRVSRMYECTMPVFVYYWNCDIKQAPPDINLIGARHATNASLLHGGIPEVLLNTQWYNIHGAPTASTVDTPLLLVPAHLAQRLSHE
jgi:hypothetical protein